MSKHSWMIDAIEENTVAIEQDAGPAYQLPNILLPRNVTEGDICSVEVTAAESAVTVRVMIDAAATKAAKARSAAQVSGKPNKNDPGGPIQL